MTKAGKPEENFGCEHCWPPAAEAAWAARNALNHVATLFYEPHFHVMILACPRCSQRFLSAFTETIDWVNGDDAQSWTLLPLTEAEAADLVQQGDSLTETALHGLGSDRRSLQRSRPIGTGEQIAWQIDIFNRCARLRRTWSTAGALISPRKRAPNFAEEGQNACVASRRGMVRLIFAPSRCSARRNS